MFYPKNKIEVISFREFVSRPATYTQKKAPLPLSICSFLPPFTIKSLLPVGDPAFALFLIAGGVIVILAFSEYMLAEFGFTEISDVFGMVSKFLIPVAGYGTILWFLSTL
jgi:hypothetical protein